MRRVALALIVVLSGLAGAAQAQPFYRHGPVYHRPHFARHFFHHRSYHRHHHFYRDHRAFGYGRYYR